MSSPSPSATDERPHRALAIYCVESTNFRSLKGLLALGADPTALDSNGASLLRLTLRNAAERGFDSQAPGAALSGLTQGRLACLQALCEAGADPSAIGGAEQCSDLHFAACRLPPFYLNALIPHASCLNSGSADRLSPLHGAALLGRLDNARLLLEAGADANARDLEGNTPLHNAAAREDIAMAALLLSHGASSVERNALGLAPWQTMSPQPAGSARASSSPKARLEGLLREAFIESERSSIGQSARSGALAARKPRSL